MLCCCRTPATKEEPNVPVETQHPPPPASASASDDEPINPIVLSKRSTSRRGGNAYTTSATPEVPSSANFALSPFAGGNDAASTSVPDPPAADPPQQAYVGAPFCTLGEHRRAKALRPLQIDKSVDTPVPLLDHLTELLGRILHCPICIVDFVDHKSLYIKSAQGWNAPHSFDRRFSICTWTFIPLKPEVLVVEDLSQDGRFMDPKDPVRFYCGVPLVSSVGERLGTLCVLDHKPRAFDAAACSVMINVAEIVIAHLEHGIQRPLVAKRLGASKPLRLDLQQRRRVALVDTAGEGWRVLSASDEWCSTLEVGRSDVVGKDLLEVLVPTRPTRLDAYRRMACEGVRFPVTVQTPAGGSVYLHMRPVFRERAFNDMPSITVLETVAKAPNALPIGSVQGLFFAVVTDHKPPPSNHGAHAPPFVPFTDVQLGRLLGAGSQGRVYMAHMAGMPVAAKIVLHTVVDKHTGTAAAARRRSALEAIIGMRLNHPHVVRHIDYAVVRTSHALMDSVAARAAGMDVVCGIADLGPSQSDCSVHSSLAASDADSWPQEQCTWILMEHCSGGSLQAAIDCGVFRHSTSVFEGGPHMERVLHVALQMASALQHLHAQGVVHGDLCPRNVLFAEPISEGAVWCAKVTDFGMAREVGCSSDGIQSETHGTVTHMPPETLVNGVCNKTTDVYSFGVMLWELYMTRRPYAGSNAMQVCAAKLLHKTTLDFAPGTPPAYKALAEQCMGPVEQRPSLDTIVQGLQDIQQQLELGSLSAAAFPAWEDPEEEQARACAWDVENDTSSSSGGEVHRTVQVMAATN